MAIKITSFDHYLQLVNEQVYNHNTIILYRGQEKAHSLIPCIGRKNPKKNTTAIEQEMLSELKRRSNFIIKQTLQNDWEWLVYAQHFGMKTRLLDWTSNPLMALWFACSKPTKTNAYVYRFSTTDDFLITNTSISPFEQKLTRVYKPILNNERIVAQAGWFTVHRFSPISKSFIGLEKNRKTRSLITKIIIPKNLKEICLSKLSILGVNNHTVFPDVVGICNHLNWSYKV